MVELIQGIGMIVWGLVPVLGQKVVRYRHRHHRVILHLAQSPRLARCTDSYTLSTRCTNQITPSRPCFHVRPVDPVRPPKVPRTHLTDTHIHRPILRSTSRPDHKQKSCHSQTSPNLSLFQSGFAHHNLYHAQLHYLNRTSRRMTTLLSSG